jgi:hypothetical protein
MQVDDNSKEEKVLVNSAIGSTRERLRPPDRRGRRASTSRDCSGNTLSWSSDQPRVTGRTDDAEDVLQTVFLRLARQEAR